MPTVEGDGLQASEQAWLFLHFQLKVQIKSGSAKLLQQLYAVVLG